MMCRPTPLLHVGSSSKRSHLNVLIHEEWPKLGIPDGYMAIIVYPSSPTMKQPQDATSLANAGHYPTVATFSPGVPDFGYSTREGYPILMPPTR